MPRVGQNPRKKEAQFNIYDIARDVNELQNVADKVLRKVNSEMAGKTIAGVTIKEFEGNVVVTLDTPLGNRKNRAEILGTMTTTNYDLEGKPTSSIVISLYFNRAGEGKYKVIGTLIHEVVHLVLAANKIQDCASQGRVHNAKFKAGVELVPELEQLPRTKENGFGLTKLSEIGRSYVDEELADVDFGTAYKKLEPEAVQKLPTELTLQCKSNEKHKAVVSVKNYMEGMRLACCGDIMRVADKSIEVLEAHLRKAEGAGSYEDAA